MAVAANTALRISKTSGLAMDVIDEFRDGSHWQFGVHDQSEVVQAYCTDRNKIFHRVVWNLHHGRGNRNLGRHRPKERVTIGGGTRDRLSRNDSVRARAVFDDERPTKRVAQLTGDESRRYVTATTGSIGIEDSYWPLRPLCRSGRIEAERGKWCQGQRSDKVPAAQHGTAPRSRDFRASAITDATLSS